MSDSDPFAPIRAAITNPDVVSVGCPVQPLGTNDGRFFVVSAIGEPRSIRDRELTQLGIIGIFNGDTEWLLKTFPRIADDGTPTGDFNHRAAAAWLIDQCSRRGVWDPLTVVCGPGIWSGPGGELVVHVGDAVAVGAGAWQRPGMRIGSAIYAAAPAIPRPAAAMATVADGQALFRHLSTWRWDVEIGADLAVGWIGAALLGAAPGWRAHLMVLGPRGCGKSELAELVGRIAGVGVQTNWTEAGLRQSLTSRAMPVILDEAENTTRAAAVLELLRHMSGGSGSRTVRGSAEGVARAFTLAGPVWLSSINGVPLNSADASRITVLRLGRLERVGGGVDRLREFADRAGPAFRARAVAEWRRFGQCFALWRAAIIRAGYDVRQADQIATLKAGQDMLLTDDCPAGEDFDIGIDQLRAADVLRDVGADDDDDEGRAALHHLLSSSVDLWLSGRRETVSTAILSAISAGPGSSSDTDVQKLGMRVMWDRANASPRAAGLLIANRHHRGLAAIFAGTDWREGGWVNAFRSFPGASPHGPVKFAGVAFRSTALPASCLPEADDGDVTCGRA